MRYLTIALTKGRLAEKTLEMFEKIGITCEEMRDKSSRKLIFVNEDLKLRGPGDFFGVRQSGMMDFVLADIYTNADIMKQAADAVKELEETGFDFSSLKNSRLEKQIGLARNI